MKRCLLIVVLLFIGWGSYGQPWSWAKRSGTNLYDNSVTTDLFGNVYVTGANTRSAIAFGSFTLTNANIFLVKYDPSGNVIWAKGATGNAFTTSVNTDRQGNVYITGAFTRPTLSFGSITLTNPNTISSAEYIYLAKYDSNGNIMWAKSVGNTDGGINIPYSMTIDAADNIYIAGEMGSTSLTFGSTILTHITPGGYDVFIAKYSQLGNAIWAKNTEADGGATSVHADNYGHILVSGVFKSDSISFGSLTLSHTTSTSQPYNGFLVKYDTSGTPIWAISEPGGNWINTWLVTSDNSGNVYLAGHFVTPITIGSTTLTGSGQPDFNLVKYDSAGGIVWVKKAGGANVDYVKEIVCDVFGNIYACGGYSSPVLTIGGTSLTNPGNFSGFLAEYDPSGNVIYSTNIGGIADDEVGSIASDASCKIYITGSFKSPSITIGTTALTNDSIGMYNMFVAKWVCEKVEVPNYIEDEQALYPNPANTECTITYNGILSTHAGIAIYDLTGRLMHTYPLTGSSTTISIAHLPPGMYVCKIDADGSGAVSRKLVVMR